MVYTISFVALADDDTDPLHSKRILGPSVSLVAAFLVVVVEVVVVLGAEVVLVLIGRY